MITPATSSLALLVHGGVSCHGRSRRALFFPLIFANNSNHSSAPVRLPSPWRSAAASFFTRLPTITPTTNRSPNNSIATDTPLANGGNAFSVLASQGLTTRHPPGDPRAVLPPQQLQVRPLAST